MEAKTESITLTLDEKESFELAYILRSFQTNNEGNKDLSGEISFAGDLHRTIMHAWGR